MAFTESERKRREKTVAAFVELRRPPVDIRDKVDIGYRVEGQSVEIFEIRPRFQNPDEKDETPVARATFVRTQQVWKVYWMRRDLKWHEYPVKPSVRTLAAFLKLVDEDDICCFWG